MNHTAHARYILGNKDWATIDLQARASFYFVSVDSRVPFREIRISCNDVNSVTFFTKIVSHLASVKTSPYRFWRKVERVN